MNPANTSPQPEYEEKDASVPVVLLSAAILVAGMIGSIAAAGWIYTVRYSGASSAGWRQTSFTKGPNERTGISQDFATMQADAKDHLQNYGWVDQKSGTVRIPIDEAIERMARDAANDQGKANP